MTDAAAPRPTDRPLTVALLVWYGERARRLPWRGPEVSAWETLLSEFMLQQTRVDTVLPYFHRFVQRFPTPAHMAAAPDDEVLALWSGLGYYARARNLKKTAEILAEAGAFPTDEAGLRALPGVGEYMAGAVGSIALGLDLIAIDGNLERVLCRVHRHPGGRKEAKALGLSLLPPGRAGAFNQALMDLGATICTPRSPRCRECPIAFTCGAAEAGEPERYPSPKPKRAVPERAAVSACVRRDGRVLVGRRPSEGLFGGLYEMPGGELDPGEAPEAGLIRRLEQRLGVGARVIGPLGAVPHVLTHMRLTQHVLAVELLGEPAPVGYSALAWIDPAAPEAAGIGLSSLSQKALALTHPLQGPLQRPLFG